MAPNKEHIFTGFGFGPIQSCLFASEAFKSGNFARIVIAEIDADLVAAVRSNNGTYHVNVAASDGILNQQIDNIEIYNPAVDEKLTVAGHGREHARNRCAGNDGVAEESFS